MARRKYDPKRVAKDLGLRVRKLRNDKGWTLEECEEHGWPNWRHLQAVEAGKPVTMVTLINLANMFGLSLSELLEGV